MTKRQPRRKTIVIHPSQIKPPTKSNTNNLPQFKQQDLAGAFAQVIHHVSRKGGKTSLNQHRRFSSQVTSPRGCLPDNLANERRQSKFQAPAINFGQLRESNGDSSQLALGRQYMSDEKCVRAQQHMRNRTSFLVPGKSQTLVDLSQQLASQKKNDRLSYKGTEMQDSLSPVQEHFLTDDKRQKPNKFMFETPVKMQNKRKMLTGTSSPNYQEISQQSSMKNDTLYKLQLADKIEKQVRMEFQLQQGLRKQVSLRRRQIVKKNQDDLNKIRNVTDAGIVKFYNSKKVESNFHNNFCCLNADYAQQRRQRAHQIAEKCLHKLRQKVRDLVE